MPGCSPPPSCPGPPQPLPVPAQPAPSRDPTGPRRAGTSRRTHRAVSAGLRGSAGHGVRMAQRDVAPLLPGPSRPLRGARGPSVSGDPGAAPKRSAGGRTGQEGEGGGGQDKNHRISGGREGRPRDNAEPFFYRGDSSRGLRIGLSPPTPPLEATPALLPIAQPRPRAPRCLARCCRRAIAEQRTAVPIAQRAEEGGGEAAGCRRPGASWSTTFSGHRPHDVPRGVSARRPRTGRLPTAPRDPRAAVRAVPHTGGYTGSKRAAARGRTAALSLRPRWDRAAGGSSASTSIPNGTPMGSSGGTRPPPRGERAHPVHRTDGIRTDSRAPRTGSRARWPRWGRAVAVVPPRGRGDSSERRAAPSPSCRELNSIKRSFLFGPLKSFGSPGSCRGERRRGRRAARGGAASCRGSPRTPSSDHVQPRRSSRSVSGAAKGEASPRRSRGDVAMGGGCRSAAWGRRGAGSCALTYPSNAINNNNSSSNSNSNNKDKGLYSPSCEAAGREPMGGLSHGTAPRCSPAAFGHALTPRRRGPRLPAEPTRGANGPGHLGHKSRRT